LDILADRPGYCQRVKAGVVVEAAVFVGDEGLGEFGVNGGSGVGGETPLAVGCYPRTEHHAAPVIEHGGEGFVEKGAWEGEGEGEEED
jgi:hypothetical protein